MDRRNFSDLGEEIRDIVQNAVNTRDFHQLNKDIGNTIDGALDEVRRSLGIGYDSEGRYTRSSDREGRYAQNQARQQSRQESRQQPTQNQARQQSRQESRRQPTHNQAGQQSRQESRQARPLAPAFPSAAVGRVSGILLTVFGSVGVGVFGVASLVLLICVLVLGNWDVLGWVTFGLSLAFVFFVGMTAKGNSIRRRLKRFQHYMRLLKGNSYYSIEDLADGTNQNHQFVLKDLRKMISAGMFPEGHIDDQSTCLMLNRESYRQYLELKKNQRLKKAAEHAEAEEMRKKGREGSKDAASSASDNSQVRQAVEAGRACMLQIKEANDAIPGEEISGKLDRLETVIGKIFNYIEQHPDRLADIRKFMDYYLPTTLKLVNAYKELDQQSIQGENITSAKNEIEETLDTINLAFENLLDSLFEDVAMDVSSDISVLETLLAQEGLTKKDFS